MTHDDDESSNGDGIKPNKIELFDCYFEVWSPLNTEGTPHPGLIINGAAKVLFGKLMYMYGGTQDMRMGMYTGVLSSLDLNMFTWSLLCPAETSGGPIRKTGFGMVHFHQVRSDRWVWNPFWPYPARIDIYQAHQVH